MYDLPKADGFKITSIYYGPSVAPWFNDDVREEFRRTVERIDKCEQFTYTVYEFLYNHGEGGCSKYQNGKWVDLKAQYKHEIIDCDFGNDSRPGALFDSKGASVFASTPAKLMYVIGMLNSKVSGVFLKVLSPAYEYKVGHVANVPMLIDSTDQVEAIVSNCIDLAQQDWDADETSWDFKKHPLV